MRAAAPPSAKRAPPRRESMSSVSCAWRVQSSTHRTITTASGSARHIESANRMAGKAAQQPAKPMLKRATQGLRPRDLMIRQSGPGLKKPVQETVTRWEMSE